MPSLGLVQSLNAIREMSVKDGKAYHEYVPIITDTTDIGALAQPIMDYVNVRNDFMSMLINKLVASKFEVKYFQNPLQILEGDTLPLGYATESIYVNPAHGRKMNVNDFAGLLTRFEADVKVQYFNITMDLQYPVTVSYTQLKKAFMSWDSLERFIDGLSLSLYNGAYLDEFRFTKNLIGGAYLKNQIQYEVVSGVNSEANAKAFVTKARELYLNMQMPSEKYNAWAKCGGAGRPVVTWSLPEDIVFVIRNDILAYLDVNVLAASFNITKSELLGRILPVDNFDAFDDEGTKIFDGSNIIGFIGDKSWFKIQRQDMFVEEFRNPNNRTYQMYLNLIKQYQYSLFANGVVICTAAPSVDATKVTATPDEISVVEGAKATVAIATEPITSTAVITARSSATGKATVTVASDGKSLEITGVDDGSATITVTATNADSSTVTDTIAVTVTAAAVAEGGAGASD